MKTCSLRLLASALCATLFATGVHAADYHKLSEIKIGGAGGFDYLSVDPAAERLYVTHGTKVVVVDTAKETVVGEVTNTPRVHGFAIVPELGRGFVSAGGENKAGIVDLKTLAILSKVETGGNPDWILYEPNQQEVYTFNGSSSSSTVFEAKTGKVVATIKLSGKPETAMVDPKAGRIYDNIENKSEIAVIDTKSHAVVATWPIAPGTEASGMAIDLEHHRLFVGCGGNNRMEMIDSTNGKVAAFVPIGGGVDANSFDPSTQLAFASCGDAGAITIAHEDSPEKLTVVQTLTTATGSRTMTVDPKTHKIYCVAGTGDTFRVLVFGM